MLGVRSQSGALAACLLLGACSSGLSSPDGLFALELPKDYGQKLLDPNARYDAELHVFEPSGAPAVGAELVVDDLVYASGADGIIDVVNLRAGGVVFGMLHHDDDVTLPVRIAYERHGAGPVDVPLLPFELDVRFSADEGASFEIDGSRLIIPARALAMPNGNIYTGEAWLRAFTVDLDGDLYTSKNGVRRPRSDRALAPLWRLIDEVQLYGLNPRPRPVEVVGAAFFELSTPDGITPLGVAPAQRVSFEARLPSTPRRPAGRALTAAALDGSSGRYLVEGPCVVTEAGTCTDTLRHFSWRVLVDDPAPPLGCIDWTIHVRGPNASVLEGLEVVAREGEVGERSLSAGPVDPAALDRLCSVGVGAGEQRVIAHVKTPAGRVSVRGEWTAPAIADTAWLGDASDAPLGPGEVCRRSACARREITLRVASNDADLDGYSSQDIGERRDCAPEDATAYPGAPEPACARKDRDCDGKIPPTVTPANAPSSGVWNRDWCSLECAERGVELPGNDVDEDCDGKTIDADGDAYLPPWLAGTSVAGLPAIPDEARRFEDCDDGDASAHPGAKERAGNPVDEDCDGYAVDVDGDGWIAPRQGILTATAALGFNPAHLDDPRLYLDCNDFDANAYPGSPSIEREHSFAVWYRPVGASFVRDPAMCELVSPSGAINLLGQRRLIDMNCDGWYSDLDGDGHTVPGDPTAAAGFDDDCNDLDPRLVAQPGCALEGTDDPCEAKRSDSPCVARVDGSPTECVPLRGSDEHVCLYRGWSTDDPPNLRSPGQLWGPCDNQLGPRTLGPCAEGLACGGPLTLSPTVLAAFRERYDLREVNGVTWVGLCWALCAGP